MLIIFLIKGGANGERNNQYEIISTNCFNEVPHIEHIISVEKSRKIFIFIFGAGE